MDPNQTKRYRRSSFVDEEDGRGRGRPRRLLPRLCVCCEAHHQSRFCCCGCFSFDQAWWVVSFAFLRRALPATTLCANPRGGMDKGKRAKVEEEDGSELDAELVQAIEKLQEVQDELERVNEEASDKVLEVEQFYNEIRRPVYSKRNDIIHNIPDFWLTAFLSHPVLCDLLTEEDQKVFKYLESLHVEDFKDVKSGYSISFNFRANPYFEDAKLTKIFSFSDEGTTSVSGTQPKWKAGMDLTNGVAPEKEGNKRPLVEESFFRWFSDTTQKVSLDGIQDEVAEVIKDDLWPNPLKYFNNEQDEDGFESGEQDSGDDEGKGNGLDDEDDEPDEDDEDEDN